MRLFRYLNVNVCVAQHENAFTWLANIKSQAFKPLDINGMTARATNITNNKNKMGEPVTRDESKVHQRISRARDY